MLVLLSRVWCSRRFLLAWAAVLVTAAFAVPPASAVPAGPSPIGVCAPGLGIGLIEFPRGTKDPRALSYIVDRVRPGAQFARQFQVCNGTRDPIRVQLYPAAAEVSGGSFTLLDGRARNELTDWIRVEPSELVIPSGERVIASARFAVPEDAEDGEQYAAIVAELQPVAPVGGISSGSRVGIRVYLAAGEGDAPANDFVISSLQAARRADGRPIVSAVVRNTGARALDLSGELRLSDGPGGLSGGPFPAMLGTTLGPGDSSPVLIVLDDAISGGPWTATLTLKSGLLERRAEAQITFPDEAGEENAPVEAKELSPVEDPDLVIPFAIGLLFLLFLALIIVGYLTSRRKARVRRPAE